MAGHIRSQEEQIIVAAQANTEAAKSVPLQIASSADVLGLDFRPFGPNNDGLLGATREDGHELFAMPRSGQMLPSNGRRIE